MLSRTNNPVRAVDIRCIRINWVYAYWCTRQAHARSPKTTRKLDFFPPRPDPPPAWQPSRPPHLCCWCCSIITSNLSHGHAAFHCALLHGTHVQHVCAWASYEGRYHTTRCTPHIICRSVRAKIIHVYTPMPSGLRSPGGLLCYNNPHPRLVVWLTLNHHPAQRIPVFSFFSRFLDKRSFLSITQFKCFIQKFISLHKSGAFERHIKFEYV